MKRSRSPWFFGGILVSIALLGLSWDFFRVYSERKRVQSEIRGVAENSAHYLPFRPLEAVKAAMRGLEEHGLKADPGSVSVSPDGYRVNISVISEVAAYMAWMIGNPRMKFRAEAVARVDMEGATPCDELRREEISFAVVNYDGLGADRPLVVNPAGGVGSGDGLMAYRVRGEAVLKVGDRVACHPVDSLKEYASRRLLLVVILSQPTDGAAAIQGFAAFSVGGIDEGGRLTGQLVRMQAEGEPVRRLNSENDFGLLRGGVPKVVIQ